MKRPSALCLLALLFACEESRESPTDGGGSRDSTSNADAAAAADAQPNSDAEPADSGASAEVLGISLLTRLAGLWSGPATATPLGDFAAMIMDFRPAGDRVLFGRVDLDASNALRFAFFVETHGGEDVLVYRNGGLFNGRSRDTRTKLVEHDETAGRWRFCAIQGDCAYVDATFTLTAPDRLNLQVMVRGQQHITWNATRQATRMVPAPFPIDQSSLGPGNAPFPTMPELAATVSWANPLAAEADVWVLLSTQDCDLQRRTCEISRHLYVAAPAGATQASLQFTQLHPGEYRGLAFVDRNRNFIRTLFPDSGDGASIPNQAITVAATGTTTANLSIVFDLP